MIGPVTDLKILKPGKKVKPFKLEHLEQTEALKEVRLLDLSELSGGLKLANFVRKRPCLFAKLETIRIAVGGISMRGVFFMKRGSSQERNSIEEVASQMFQLPSLNKVEFQAIGKVQSVRREDLER